MSINEISHKPQRPFGRSLSDFENLSDSEKRLIACAARGKICRLGEVTPEKPTPENVIRPELIRFLALGGDDTAPVHEKGVELHGAYIGNGSLDFEGARLTTNLWLINCNFPSPLTFQDARASNLSLEGSVFPGLSADRLNIEGDLLLRHVRSKGTVRLGGAEIGGGLDCSGGHFENKYDKALLCDGARIGGDVFFSESLNESEKMHHFYAIGKVSFIGAKIGGSLNCNGGRFENEGRQALSCDGAKIGGCVFLGMNCDRTKKLRHRFHAIGEVCFVGATIGASLSCNGGLFENKVSDAISCDSARIGGSILCRERFRAIGAVRFPNIIVDGDLDCRGGRFKNDVGLALFCYGAEIGGGLFFPDNIQAKGFISLAHAKVGALADNINCWPDKSLDLDGFRYERIASNSSLDAKSRIAWLDKQRPELLTGDSFAIQPWIHLAKVLREQGHFREAAEVDIAREERLRAAGKVGDPKWGRIDTQGKYVTFFSSINEYVACFFHWFYGLISGYGHRPLRIIYLAALLWLFCAVVFEKSADSASFAPSNDSAAKLLREDCNKKDASQNLDLIQCAEILNRPQRFSPWVYSLDLILPVARLGQSAAWAPTSDAVWTQRLVWIEEIFGWVAALTLAAIATGLVKRKDG